MSNNTLNDKKDGLLKRFIMNLDGETKEDIALSVVYDSELKKIY